MDEELREEIRQRYLDAESSLKWISECLGEPEISPECRWELIRNGGSR